MNLPKIAYSLAQRVRMTGATLRCVAALFCLSALPTSDLHAVLIHESATLGTTGQVTGGGSINDVQWLGSRFSTTQTWEVTAVGGHIAGIDDGTLFAAIVALPSPTGIPAFSPNDIETEALGATTFGIAGDLNSFEVSVPLSLILPAGDYGIVLGSGAFNTTGRAAAPSPSQTGAVSFPGASYLKADVDATPDAEWNTLGDVQNRFFVEAVPEPASLALLILACACMLGRVRFVGR